MRKSQILVVTSLLAGACAPQSAELLSGEFIAFVAETNSVTLRKDLLDLEAFDNYHQVDCRMFIDEESGSAQRLEDRLLNCGWGDDDRDDEAHFFRDTDNNREEYDGDPVIDIDDLDDDDDGVIDFYDCDDSNAAVGSAGSYNRQTLYDGNPVDWTFHDDPSNCAGGGDGYWPPVQEDWLSRDGFHVVSGELEPWRGEGIVTHEGDLLVGFHHSMPGGADIRFQFALDRFFQPTECIVQDDGSVVAAAIDGDWIDEWSTELDYIASLEGDDFEPYAHLEPYLDGGRMWMLNAGSYQYNPEENADWWYTPEQWAAGAAQATFGEEQMTHRPQLFAEPELYNLFATLGLSDQDLGSSGLGDAFTQDYLWWCEEDSGTEWADSNCLSVLEERVNRTADHAMAEFNDVSVAEEGEEGFAYRPMVHLNKWRGLDGTAAGYDGWGEMDYNYVVLSEDSDLRIGGRVEGAFTLVFDGEESTSRLFVKGQFVIDKLKADTWAPQDLRAEKRDASGVEYCAY